ncbi:MAG: glycogen-binding domain-containing protein [Chitinophagales bacterium]
MKRFVLYQFTILIISLIIQPVNTFTQNTGDVIHVENNQLIITLDKRNKDEYNNLLIYFGLNEDSLFQFGNIGALGKEGWTLIKVDKNTALIAKPLNADAQKFNWGNQPIFFDQVPPPGEPGYPGPVTYGINNFKKTSTVFENADGKTIFFLRGFKNSAKVMLSGNFNRWSENGNPMQKTDSGWITTMDLEPGKYFYKFIIDGNWKYDENNSLKEPDGYGSYNSTYFRYNYSFLLKGFSEKKNVVVSGSFNNWNELELKMKRSADGWKLDAYLGEGMYTYKFIVDGEWMLDPENKNVRDDGTGNFNNFIGLGDEIVFKLDGYPDAKNVVLTGTFNGWNTSELRMTKTADGWQIPFVLAPGNYEYKFIVDGKWITDPDNDLKRVGEDPNSVLIIKSNYTFLLNTFPAAKEVLLSGDFNNWAEPGYAMLRSDAGWSFPVFLITGKHLYKYIVDGKWITDPTNPLYEENEFGTGNSVLWIDTRITK